MPTQTSGRRVAGLATVALAIAGCSLNPKEDPSRFYVLTASESESAGPAAAADSLWIEALGVGPVRFPAYLDRPQMVTRISNVEVSVSEFERWAELPAHNFTRVLARNLEVQFANMRVETHPYVAGVDYAIRVQIRRFERDASGTATLDCSWVLVDSGLGVVLSRESSYRARAADTTTEAAVAALSRTVEELSEEIARVLRGLPPPEPDAGA